MDNTGYFFVFNLQYWCDKLEVVDIELTVL